MALKNAFTSKVQGCTIATTDSALPAPIMPLRPVTFPAFIFSSVPHVEK